MTSAQLLIADCRNGKCPSARELIDLCTAIHGVMCAIDAPELIWMDQSFEDMADVIASACKCAQEEEVMA